jgi:hypothetical protein
MVQLSRFKYLELYLIKSVILDTISEMSLSAKDLRYFRAARNVLSTKFFVWQGLWAS